MRVQHLSAGGAFYRELHGHDWTDLHNLLAEIVDVTAAYGAGTIRSNGGKVRRPRPIKRPGRKRQGQIGDVSGQDQEQVLDYLQALLPPPPGELPAAPVPLALTVGGTAVPAADPPAAEATPGAGALEEPPPLTLTPPNGA